ncbi:Theronine dehydrogenase-like Zn-dependent dehydrogenase [Desulfosarcina cetonica]|uniref:zinc-dependent dehydrogenase n=1 Tax=Desulfosarcina cetonica TaxID=90730 RepID=UPI0006D185EB|nr:zinc-dependent dehydrogenase [Desulfosarcina cetonica]VTR69674.1 Theronine dehydrogenase-like Zn-dependent dehydrogenase [Desulfosarcina cetonica]
MKAAVVYGKDDIRIEEYPTPTAGAGEMVVRTRVSGICATDIKTLLGQGLPKELPTILGHEVVGEIAEIGSGVDGYAIGERVAVYPIAVCGQCEYCRKGRHNLCDHEFGLAHGIAGGFAEYVRLPRQIIEIGGVVKLADDLPFERAVLAEPLSCAYASLRTCRVTAGDRVVILGAGPMGLMHLKLAKWMGATVIVVDILENRLKIAAQMGADHCINSATTDHAAEIDRLTEGRGAAVVIASLGIPKVVEANLKLTGKGGTFNIFGGPPAGETIRVDPRWLHYMEITLTGTFACSPDDFRHCLELIRTQAITVDDLVSDTFTLDNFLDAVERAKAQAMIRGIVTF